MLWINSYERICRSKSRSRSSAVSRADIDALKLHKEVIEMTKFQMWPMDKKLRVIQQAKEFVKRHESEMEERLAQSDSFSSRLQQFNLYVFRFMVMVLRQLRDIMAEFAPWQQKIKDIESHFGSVVSSYFVFLR